tara:strand:+ start:630 stop:1118 length:489 start_codon:yes stop_codon:yes gene_type:complete
MNNEKIKKIIISLIFVVIIFSIDRISKILILNIVNETGKIDIYVNSFLNLYLVWNKGIGFGLLSFNEKSTYDIITFIILLINLIIIYLIYIEKTSKIYFLLAILGGSLGNLFDRIYYNAVPDFIDINYKDYHWFIFNVADIFITFGILCLIISEMLNYKKSK